MMEFMLPYDITTLDKKVFLPAGRIITETVLDEILTSNKKKPKKRRVAAHGNIIHDLERLLTVPPYDFILEDPSKRELILNQVGKTDLALPILNSLDYFREHDFYTYRHTLLVFVLTLLITQKLLPHTYHQVSEIMAGPSHDIGKISIPLEILKKTSPLTKKEKNMLHHHAMAGYVLLTHYLRDRNNIAAIIARDHHERRDGSGYPRGITQTDLLVDIVIVCDIYDALISPRPYREICYDNRTALEHLTDMADKGKIGWEALRALIALNRKDKPDFRELTVSVEKRGTPPPFNNYDLEADDF